MEKLSEYIEELACVDKFQENESDINELIEEQSGVQKTIWNHWVKD